MPTVLLIANSPEERAALEQSLKRLDYGVIAIGNDALQIEAQAARRSSIDISLIVATESKQNIGEEIDKVRTIIRNAPILIITEPGQSQLSMEAIAGGAHDFLYLPVTDERLLVSMRNALRFHEGAAPTPNTADSGFGEFIGRSDVLMYLLLKARAQAVSGKHVYLCGERGVGKTMLARAMHRSSERGAQNLRMQNVRQSAELIHHLERAEAGETLVLDLPEPGMIDEISTDMAEQTAAKANEKMIRLIVCQRMPRRTASGRLPTTPLLTALDAETLFLPSLRQRNEDIVSQCDYFLSRTAQLLNRQPLVPTAQAYRSLMEYEWPGNTRELLYVVFQAYLVADGPQLTSIQLEPLFNPVKEVQFDLYTDLTIRPFDDKGDLRTLEDIETELMTLAFRHYHGSRSEIARRLGIGRTTLYRKARQLGLV